MPGRVGNEHAGRGGAVQPGLSCQVEGCPWQVIGPCEQQRVRHHPAALQAAEAPERSWRGTGGEMGTPCCNN